MSALADLFRHASRRARERRHALFRSLFRITGTTRILDLGSESGGNITRLVGASDVCPSNVYIADISAAMVAQGHASYGYTPVTLSEDATIPFPDGFFDIVYCSSVIEHVTVPKRLVWTTVSDEDFENAARARQQAFALEIRRVARQYWVQTPNRGFLIESHSWIPFASWLGRRNLLRLLRFSNRFWIKKTSPDWHLLNPEELARMFPDAQIWRETWFGLTKSMVAMKVDEPTV